MPEGGFATAPSNHVLLRADLAVIGREEKVYVRGGDDLNDNAFALILIIVFIHTNPEGATAQS